MMSLGFSGFRFHEFGDDVRNELRLDRTDAILDVGGGQPPAQDAQGLLYRTNPCISINST